MPRTLNRRTPDDSQGDDAPTTRGWGATKNLKDAVPNKWGNRYQASKEEELPIKFLEDEPYANLLQHWVDEMPKGKQKSFNCPHSLDRSSECPLCDYGHKPQAFVMFNIVDLAKMENAFWQVGVTVAGDIQEVAESKWGPLTNPELYFGVRLKRASEKATWRTSLRHTIHVDEDFGSEYLLSPEQLEHFSENLLDDSTLQWPTAKELQEIVDEYLS